MSTYPNLTAAELAYRSTLAGPTDSVAGADAKLWLPIWSGEVLHAYDEYRMFEPLVTNKTIASGRSMEFPITGTVDLKPAWGAGEYLHGDENSKAGNFAVTLDNRPMAAHFELDNVDLMITQWEYRQELARQAGLTLANAAAFRHRPFQILRPGRIWGDSRGAISADAMPMQVVASEGKRRSILLGEIVW